MLIRLVLLFFGCSVVAQDVSESLRVVVRDVRVHVVDRDGKPITGLDDIDFRLKEGGEVRELVFFEEVDRRFREGSRPGTERSTIDLATGVDGPVSSNRAMVLFLDTSNIHKPAFDAMMAASEEIIRRETADGTRIKLVHYDETIHDLSPFSRDTEMLVVALGNAVYRGRFLERLRLQQRRVIEARDRLEDARRRELGRSTNEAKISGIDLGEGLAGVAIRPDIAAYLESLQKALTFEINEKERMKMSHFRAYSFHMDLLSRSLAAFPESKSIIHISGGVYMQGSNSVFSRTTSEADLLGRMLNSRNVTVYSLLQTDIRPIGTDTPMRFAVDPEDFITNGSTNGLLEDDFQMQSGPLGMAERTGGFFVRATGLAKTSEKLFEIQNASRHYYRLVYTVDPETAGRAVQVKLDRRIPGASVVYGKDLYKPKPFSQQSQIEKDVSFEAQLRYASAIRNDLDAAFHYHRFRAEDGKIAIPVTVDLPLRDVPDNGYELGLAAFGDQDTVYDVVKTTLGQLPAKDGLRLHQVLIVDENPTRLRFFLRDLDSGDYALQEERVETSFDRADHFQLSEVIVTQDDHFQLLALNQMVPEPEQKPAEKKRRNNRRQRKRQKEVEETPDRKTDFRKEQDPLVMNRYMVRGKQAEPMERGKPLEVFFHLYNLADAPEHYRVRASVRQGQRFGSAPLEIIDVYQPRTDHARFRGRIRDIELDPGAYELVIQAFHKETGEADSRVVPILIGGEG